MHLRVFSLANTKRLTFQNSNSIFRRYKDSSTQSYHPPSIFRRPYNTMSTSSSASVASLTTESTSATSVAPARATLLADNASIEKPLLDNRSYRFIKLNDNNLHALLIHDPTTDKSAASLDVNVGSFADAEYGVPGLAHFCEHLLFMGTKKFPQENEYSSYLSKHAGHSNAYTASEHTNYYFEVDSHHLHGALDRFGQFFIEPLFSNSCKDREIKAVDLENKKNLQNDMWRLYQLDRLLSNEKHPYNGFSTGNFETLHVTPTSQGVDVREVLMDFHLLHYSSNIMSLVILGKESLEELEHWTTDIFSRVPNKDLARPSYGGELIYNRGKDLLKLIQAKPVLETDKLELSFMIPDDQEGNWDSKPSSYYSHLLGHEGKGSLLYYLKQEKGWVNELSAGNMTVCQGSSLFGVELELTSDGLQNWQEVLVACFQYIKLIKSEAPQEWIHEEIAKMSEVDFKFKQKQSASSTVSKLSSKLIKNFEDGTIPSSYILSSGILREFNQRKIVDFGKYLNWDNLRVTLASQKLPESLLTAKERWYGTEYSVLDIPSDLLHRIQTAQLNELLTFPMPNNFIPTDFTIFAQKAEVPLRHPYLVEKDSNKFQVWYKQDDQFEVPKGIIEAVLHLPNTNASLISSTYTSLWLELIEDELNEISYYASIVGLHYQIHPWRDGLLLRVSGYNDKLKVLADTILQKIISFQPKKDRFEILKEKLRQQMKNFGYGVPYNQISTYFLVLMNDHTYTNEDRLTLLSNPNDVTFEGLQSFIKNDIWSSGIFGEILVHGNFKLEACNEIYSIFNDTFKDIKPIGGTLEEIEQVIRYQSFVVEDNSFVRYELPLADADNVNSCIDYNIQIGDMKDKKLRVLTDLFGTIIQEPCFNQLRTKEQLGYVVFLGPKITRTHFGFRVLIQSERTTDYLEYRIEEFLHKFGNFVLKELNEESFEKYKQSLKAKKLTKLKNLKEEGSRFWGAITDGYLDFQIKEKQVEILETITLSEFQDFFKRYISADGNAGRVVVHLKSQCPVEQPKSKLIHSSVVNYLYRHDLTLGSDSLDEILLRWSEAEKQAETEDYGKLSQNIVSALVEYKPGEQDSHGEPNVIDDADKLRDDLASTIAKDIDAPVPAKYPQGELIASVDQFKRSSKKGGIPVSVDPLSKFYLPKVEEPEVHL